MNLRRIVEALLLAAGMLVVCLMLKSDRWLVRAVTVIGIFALDFILDVTKTRKTR